MNTPIVEIVPRVILLVGLPGAGKSTYAREQKLPVLSSDQLRCLLLDDVTAQGANARVFYFVHLLLRERLTLLRPVTCIDATSLNRAERLPYIELAREFGARIEAVYFDVPLEVCQRRNASRQRVVPPEAMLLLAGRLEPPSVEEGFDQITRLC